MLFCKPSRRKGTEMQVCSRIFSIRFLCYLDEVKIFLGNSRVLSTPSFLLFLTLLCLVGAGREQMFVLLDRGWTWAVTQHRADRLKLSSHLTQRDNPNCPIVLVYVLIVKRMAFQAAFRIFTALSNYSIFMLIRNWKCLYWTWIFLLRLSLHPLIHALVLTSLTAIKPELFL